MWIDLLDPVQEELFSKNPLELRKQAEAIQNSKTWIVIDEIQKIPKLLDLVHQLIESRALNFAMTGSSAEKAQKRRRKLAGW